MGFQFGHIMLKWPSDHVLEGLEVACRRRPFGQIIDQWVADADDRDWGQLSVAERKQMQLDRLDEFASLIVSWNLDDERGEPVAWPPVDSTGVAYAWPPEADTAWGTAGRLAGRAVLLRHFDILSINAMREAYTEGLSRLAPPLLENSAGGPGGSPAEGPSGSDDEPQPWTPEEAWTMPAAETIDHPV